MSIAISFQLNGEPVSIELAGDEMLQHALRELGIRSCRLTCGIGVCGACTVGVGSSTVASCILPAVLVDGEDVMTVEGVPSDDPVVRAFDRHRAFQCGYCTPGAVMEARALLEESDEITPELVRHRMAGNLCRCGCYKKIEEAVLSAASGSDGDAE